MKVFLFAILMSLTFGVVNVWAQSEDKSKDIGKSPTQLAFEANANTVGNYCPACQTATEHTCPLNEESPSVTGCNHLHGDAKVAKKSDPTDTKKSAQ